MSIRQGSSLSATRIRVDAPALSLPVTANLAAWYSPEDLALADLATVTAWSDRSAQGNHLAQTTGNNQPSMRTAGINGRPAVSFDGTDVLVSPALTGISMTAMSIFLVVQQDVNAAAAQYTMLQLATPNGGFQYRLTQDVARRQHTLISNTQGLTYATNAVTAGPGHVLSVRVTAPGRIPSAIAYTLDGAADGNTTPPNGTGFLTTTPPGVQIGGKGPGATDLAEPWLGLIGEVLIYDRVLSDAETLDVNRYLGARYGITTA